MECLRQILIWALILLRALESFCSVPPDWVESQPEFSIEREEKLFFIIQKVV